MPLKTHFIFGSAIVLTGFTPSFLEDMYPLTQELVFSVSEGWKFLWDTLAIILEGGNGLCHCN